MRIPHYLTRTAAGFSFRCRVPRDLHALTGRKVIKRALRTQDRATAQARALALARGYSRTFDQLRGGNMTKPPSVDEILRKLASNDGRTSEYIINGPNGFAIEANGTDDHRRAMEALKEIGRLRPDTPAPAVAATIAPNITRLRATDALKRFLAAIKADTLPKTYRIKDNAVSGFVEHFTHTDKSRPIDTATRADVAEWVQFLRNGELATPTIVNKLSYVRGFFTWATNAGFYPAGDNPATGQAKFGAREKRLRRRHGFRALTLDEVKKIFSPEAFTGLGGEARWGAVIGLYTGARVAEVGQLALSDFDDTGPVPSLTITDDGKGQSLKNEGSRRTIPIHADLIALGLLDRVKALREAGDSQLFPGVKLDGVNGAGNWLSKAFTRHLSCVGVVAQDDEKVGFHSLRKTVIQTMQTGFVPAEHRANFVGHELEGVHFKDYGRTYTPAELARSVLVALVYPLGLDGLRPLLTLPKARRR